MIKSAEWKCVQRMHIPSNEKEHRNSTKEVLHTGLPSCGRGKVGLALKSRQSRACATPSVLTPPQSSQCGMGNAPCACCVTMSSSSTRESLFAICSHAMVVAL